ncbi:MAG: LD-carboxypeptidase [Bdellovibrionota bacterium]
MSQNPPITLPHPLRPASLIRIVAPSSPFQRDRFVEAKEWIEKQGYQVHHSKAIFSKEAFLAGSDDHRRMELEEALEDFDCHALFLARGGYGLMRLFHPKPLAMRNLNQKIIMGMSDHTPLLNYIAFHLGLVTVHGPVLAGSLFEAISKSQKMKLFDQLETAQEKIIKKFQVVRPGMASARLWGGNLRMIQSTLSTCLEIPFREGILFLEDLAEEPYQVDRMLCQLAMAGKFENLRGLIFGDLTDRAGKQISSALIQRWMDRFVSQDIPIFRGVRIGHHHMEALLPIGGKIRMDSQSQEIVISPLVQS